MLVLKKNVESSRYFIIKYEEYVKKLNKIKY